MQILVLHFVNRLLLIMSKIKAIYIGFFFTWMPGWVHRVGLQKIFQGFSTGVLCEYIRN
jgi:hypothetical protein